jgi:hypothetical protein
MGPSPAELPPIELRSAGRMALLGIVGAGMVSLLFGLARAIGFLRVRLEDIPGETIGNYLLFQSRTFDWFMYFLMSAAFGLAYRFIFRTFNRADGNFGAKLGIIQYFAAGTVLAVLEPFIPTDIQMLPSQPPFHSGMSFLAYAWILVIHVFYGWFLGIFATRTSLDIEIQEAFESEGTSHETSKVNGEHQTGIDERLAS